MDTGPRSLLPMLSMASQLCSNRRMLSPRTQSSVLLLSNSGLHYSALSPSNVDQLQKGMQSSIEIQRAILRQGSSAITKTGFIQSAKKFWWVKLDDSVDMSKLCHPQALTKFGFFLIDAPKELGARMKPLICACLAREPEKVLVVGVCGKTRLGAVQGNAPGNACRSVAEEIGADYFHDMFESSWIVLDAVAVSSFMIRLTKKL